MAGKVWLITGSSRGLGRALAEAVLALSGRVSTLSPETRQYTAG